MLDAVKVLGPMIAFMLIPVAIPIVITLGAGILGLFRAAGSTGAKPSAAGRSATARTGVRRLGVPAQD